MTTVRSLRQFLCLDPMATLPDELDCKGPDENPPEKSEANSLRVLTWNLHYWTDVKETPTFDRIVDSVHAIDADIAFLQEVVVGLGQLEEGVSLCPAQSLEDTFPSYTPAWARAAEFYAQKHWVDKGDKRGKRHQDGGFGNAVLIHKRLGGVKYQERLELLPRYSGGERRTAAIATLRDARNGLNLAVASCHLDAHGESSTRHGQAAHLAKHLQERFPDDVLIIGGDFNAKGEIGRGMVAFQRAQLTAAAAGMEVGLANEFAIDHIFYQGDVKPVDCVAIRNLASDHFPVLAHFVATQPSPGTLLGLKNDLIQNSGQHVDECSPKCDSRGDPTKTLQVVVGDAQGKEKLLALSSRSMKDLLSMAKQRLNLRKRPSSVSDVSGQIVDDERLLYVEDGVKLFVA